ncbi:MAG TPA: hypothetical protein VHE78_02435 [Gemmatimonadaceae bacterium]|nr:hypothetical protein [Gemmatimonadaceae bacterium]
MRLPGRTAPHAARDVAEVERLLAHRLARILARDVLAEAQTAAMGALGAAPLCLIQLRHQTAQLLAGRLVEPEALEAPEPLRAEPSSITRRPAERVQLRLPLSA